MALCLVCGRETDFCLCDGCREQTDLYSLASDVINYAPGSGKDPLWEKIAASLGKPYHFRDIAFALGDFLASPQKEFIRFMSLSREFAARPFLKETYEKVIGDPALSPTERTATRSVMLDLYFSGHEYEKCEEIASYLRAAASLPHETAAVLGGYYTKTRRYAEAEAILKAALASDPADTNLSGQLEECVARGSGKKKAYLPLRPEEQEKYAAFLTSVGVPFELAPKRNKPIPIPVEEYPAPVVTRDAPQGEFVAFDVETTGISPKTDSITEIGAVRVRDGEISMLPEDTFRETVRPIDKKISPEITKLTGITQKDADAAREIWDVIRDFQAFIGNDTLVGYNSARFDSRFLVRAGRYGHVLLTNPHFDVLDYVKAHQDDLKEKPDRFTLGAAAKALSIDVPEEHHALADAVTTAKVFLKLYEAHKNEEKPSLDDLLSDIDNW